MRTKKQKRPVRHKKLARSLLAELEEAQKERLNQLKREISHGDYLTSSTAIARSLIFPIETGKQGAEQR